jgi:hypothetical protein
MHNFNKALRSSLIFLLIVVLISAVIAYPYFHSETYHYQDGYVRDSLAGSLDLIICGASQAQRGISPTVLDAALGSHSYNIASPLMTLKARYTILNKELSRNDVDLVILELCYDTMARDRDVVGPEGDLYMMGRFTSFSERLSYFFSCARLEEYADFYYDILDRGIASWKVWGSRPIGCSASYETRGFAPLTAVSIPMIQESQLHQESIGTNVAEENLEYLEKILALCRDREIPVIMVATPLSDAAILSYDKLDVIHDFYTDISRKWDCEYYNFSLYKGKSELFPDSGAYYDRNHLGAPGAEVFTELLAEIAENSLAGVDLSHLFYTSYAEAEQEEILPRCQWE